MNKRIVIGLLCSVLSMALYATEYDYSVTPNTGGTVVVSTSDDVTFTLTPLSQDGWTFIGWDDDGDGVVDNTDNPRTITATSDDSETYGAVFSDARCAAFVAKIDNPSEGGIVTSAAGECACQRVLTATADAANGYLFVGWSDGNTDNPRTVTLNTGNKQNVYSAIFQQSEFESTLTSGIGGAISMRYDESLCQRVINAIPYDGWKFKQWSDGVLDSTRAIGTADDTYEVTFEDHRCAFYIPKTIPTGGGSITVENGTCDCDRILTATPASGYLFIGWTDGNTNPTRTVTIDPSQKQNIYGAIFELPEFDAVPSAGEGGSVKTEYDESECALKVRALPADGWTFKEWSDGNTDNPRTLTGAATYTATFEDHRCLSYVAKTLPVSGGHIEVSQEGLCDCERQLTAVPDAGYFFVGWNDGNTDNPRIVDINSDKRQNTYTARFERPGYTVTTHSDDGRVIAEWDEDACQMKLYAIAGLGWHFEGWDDDEDGDVDNNDNPRILISFAPQYKAIFTERRCLWYYPTINTPADGGSITVDQGVCDCDRLLTAVPNTGYIFYKWEDDSQINPRNVTLETSQLIYNYCATFIPADARIDGWTGSSMVVTSKSEDLTPTTATILVDGVPVSTDLSLTSEDAGLWSLPAELNAHAGKHLLVIFFDELDNPVNAIDTVVPYVVTTNVDFSALGVPDNTDIEVVSGTIYFDIDALLGALDVYPNAKAIIPVGKHLTYTHIYMRGDGINNGYPQLVANGSITNLNGDTIYYDYTLDYKLYYPLAVPYDVSCNTIRTKSGKRASYEVQYYDGEERAYNVTGWKVFDDQAVGATLRTGTGYIVYAVPYKWNGTRQKSVVVRFPMHADLTSPEPQKSTTVSLYEFDDLTFPSNKNWNFIGNPYLADYTPSGNDRLMVGYYTPGTSTATNFDYTYHEDLVRYLTHSADGFKTYTQARAQDMTMRSFNPYFLQAATAGELTFTLSQRAQNAPRRMADAEQLTVDEDLAYGVVLTATNALDRTGLLYGDEFTDAYEMNADLVKLFGSAQGLSVYTLAGSDERAFNALSLSNILRPVPVGFRNAPVGEMVFCFDETHYDASLFDAVMLTDYEAGRVVNLLDEDYPFTTNKSQNDTRFALYAVLAPKATTDIDYTGGAGVQSAEDGIYDLLGRRVSLDMLPQGVYIIIENGQCRKEVRQ